MNPSISEILSQADAYERQMPSIAAKAQGSEHIEALIDHTLLKPEATPSQIEQLCREASQYHFCSVCINPINVPLAARTLNGTNVKVCTVVGFPLGATPTTVKTTETRCSISSGATEIDMVIPIGLLKGGEYQQVLDDIQAIVETSHGQNALVKVILEMALLTQREKIIGCLLTQRAGADFVKTSTGFGPGGATVDDVRLMRAVVGPDMGVKAAGGIRSLEDAVTMIQAGATRLGTSSGVKIIQQALSQIHQA